MVVVPLIPVGGSLIGVTVNVRLLVVAGQAPLAGILYLTVTEVFEVTFAGV